MTFYVVDLEVLFRKKPTLCKHKTSLKQNHICWQGRNKLRIFFTVRAKEISVLTFKGRHTRAPYQYTV